MSEQASEPVRRPRINPFVFPSETTLRFGLLVVFVLCGSAGFYGDFRGTQIQASEACAAQLIPKLLKLTSSMAGNDIHAVFAEVKVHFRSLAGCAALLRPQALWHLGGMGLVIVVAAIIYYLYPAWTLKIGRLEPIGPSEFPELVQELSSLTQTARLRHPVVFVWNPVAGGLPVVFGRYRKHYVALSGLFVSQYFYGDRKSFRAILLHELAHIHNGDIYKTYITISLWLAFVATALAPAAAIFLWRLTTLRWWEAAPLLLNGILWTGIVILSGLAVLRSREYYADVQASIWDQRSQIDRVLAALPVPAGKPWRYCLRAHPDPRERRQIVDDPSRLLRLSFADAFGIGIAAWLVVGVVTGILYPFMPSHPWAAIAFTGSVIFGVPAFVFILAIGALGIDVWRSAFASLLKGDPASEGTGWLAVAFVAGAFPALALSLTEAVLLSLGEQSTRVGFAPGLFLVKAMTYCALLAGCLLIFRWISQTTSAWFEVVLQCRSPKWVLLSSVVAALVLIVITLFVGLNAAMRIALGVRDSGLSGIGSTWTIPILIVSLIAWVFPLAATWWRKPMASPEIGRLGIPRSSLAKNSGTGARIPKSGFVDRICPGTDTPAALAAAAFEQIFSGRDCTRSPFRLSLALGLDGVRFRREEIPALGFRRRSSGTCCSDCRRTRKETERRLRFVCCIRGRLRHRHGRPRLFPEQLRLSRLGECRHCDCDDG